ncbi:Ig-like domain-containing protein, partial [Planococcus sp. SIMBA_143]
DEGDQATVTKKINVVNQPPEAGFETDATEYFIGDTVKVKSTATDPDKDPLSFKYVVTKPNGSTFTKTTKDFTFKTDQL